jgi:hypothetical protein
MNTHSQSRSPDSHRANQRTVIIRSRAFTENFTLSDVNICQRASVLGCRFFVFFAAFCSNSSALPHDDTPYLLYRQREKYFSRFKFQPFTKKRGHTIALGDRLFSKLVRGLDPSPNPHYSGLFDLRSTFIFRRLPSNRTTSI